MSSASGMRGREANRPPRTSRPGDHLRKRPEGEFPFLALGLGTFGTDCIQLMRAIDPGTWKRSIGIESARPPAGRDPEEVRWSLKLSEQGAQEALRAGHPLLRDGLIDVLDLPPARAARTEEVRLLASIEAAPRLDEIKGAIDKVLAKVLRNPAAMAGRRRIVAQIIASGCDGVGSGLIPIVALLVHDRVRNHHASLELDLILHLAGPSMEQGLAPASQGDAERLLGNCAATLAEIAHAQDWRNTAALQKALGIKIPVQRPAFATLIPYETDASRPTPPRDELMARIVQNALLYRGEPVVALEARRDANPITGRKVGFGPPEFNIVQAGQAMAAGLPAAVAELFTVRREEAEIREALRRPSSDLILLRRGEVLKELDLTGLITIAHRTFARIGDEEGVRIDPRLAKMEDEEALRHLQGIRRRWKAEVRPRVDAAHADLLRKFEEEQARPVVARIRERVLRESKSIPEARGIFKAVGRKLLREADGLQKQREAIRGMDHSEQFKKALELLEKRVLFINRKKARADAAAACEEWKKADAERVMIAATEAMTRSLAREFGRLVAEASESEQEVRSRLDELEGEGILYETAALATNEVTASIIAPDELGGFLDRIARAAADFGIGEASPLAPARIFPARPMESIDLGAIFAERRHQNRERYERIMAELGDLSGVIAFGQLRFDLAAWATQALAQVAPSAPLNIDLVGGAAHAPDFAYLAAGGRDFRRLQLLIKQRPEFRLVEVCDGGNPFIAIAKRRIAGMPLASLPFLDLYFDAKHAFEARGARNWSDLLASSGFLAGASEAPFRVDRPREEAAMPLKIDLTPLPPDEEETRTPARDAGKTVAPRFAPIRVQATRMGSLRPPRTKS